VRFLFGSRVPRTGGHCHLSTRVQILRGSDESGSAIDHDPGVTVVPKLSVVHVVAALPAWMLADGEYAEVAVGRTAEFGFALEAETVEFRSATPGIEQDVERVPRTTVSGKLLVPSPDAPGVVDTGGVTPILVEQERAGDRDVVAQGRLVVEPFLWASDSVLWPLVPDGVRLWSVDRIRSVGTDVVELDTVPDVTTVDHDSTYLLDLSRPG
jgi:hypothetical protein